MKKEIFLLNVDGYSPDITAITYPLIRYYAQKIGAGIHYIDKRRFPEWPVTYEKLQIYDLAREHGNDWNIYIDSDAIVHPEMPDWTDFLPRDTVAHNAVDMAAVRWTYDRFFRRDGRNVGSCNWFTIASAWCVELWAPLTDLTLAEALERIHPTVGELNTVITPEHLIDDYALSRNIAKYGLKVETILALQKRMGWENANFLWHDYTHTREEKVALMREVIDHWKIPAHIRTYEG